jgi:hypothetical protein
MFYCGEDFASAVEIEGKISEMNSEHLIKIGAVSLLAILQDM